MLRSLHDATSAPNAGRVDGPSAHSLPFAAVNDPTSPAGERFLVAGRLGCVGAWTVKALVDEGVPVVAFERTTDPGRLRLVMARRALEGVDRPGRRHRPRRAKPTRG
jgi:hypothetical protein